MMIRTAFVFFGVLLGFAALAVLSAAFPVQFAIGVGCLFVALALLVLWTAAEFFVHAIWGRP